MPTLEQVEKLREKIDVSYEEAKEALEQCDDDLLDAIVYLEKQGKESKSAASSSSTESGTNNTYSTRDGDTQEDEYYEEHTTTYTTSTDSGSFVDSVNKFFVWLGRLIKRGNENHFEVISHGKKSFSVPVTVFVLLLILPPTMPFVIIALIIGLICGARYQFTGSEFGEANTGTASPGKDDPYASEESDAGQDTADDKQD